VSARDRRAFLKLAGAGGVAFLARASGAGAASVAARAELHLALLSDTHVPADRVSGHRGMNPWENARVAAAQVAAARPDGVLVCGDVARLQGREEDYRELSALLAPVAAVAPLYVALGNHDDRASFRRIFADTSGWHAPVDGKLVTVVEHEAVRVVALDSLLYVNQVAGLLGKAERPIARVHDHVRESEALQPLPPNRLPQGCVHRVGRVLRTEDPAGLRDEVEIEIHRCTLDHAESIRIFGTALCVYSDTA